MGRLGGGDNGVLGCRIRCRLESRFPIRRSGGIASFRGFVGEGGGGRGDLCRARSVEGLEIGVVVRLLWVRE